MIPASYEWSVVSEVGIKEIILDRVIGDLPYGYKKNSWLLNTNMY